MARRSLSLQGFSGASVSDGGRDSVEPLQGFSGASVSDGGRDSVEPPHVTEGLQQTDSTLSFRASTLL